MEDFPEEQQSPLAVNVLHRFGKHERIEEPIHNMLDEQLKSAEEYPEPLPTPLALNPMKISPFKKSGSEYRTYNYSNKIINSFECLSKQKLLSMLKLFCFRIYFICQT